MRTEVLRRQARQRQRTRLFLWVIILFVLVGVALWWQQKQQHGAEVGADQVTGVASVIDGDTLEIRDTKIRLFGVDAPESTQTCQRGRQVYPCGREAANELSKLLGQHTVTCQKRDTDRYGRTVAVCHVGNVDVNAWLVSNGYALAYREYSTDYVDEENAARKARRGIHAGTYVNPSDYRKGETTPATTSTTNQPYSSCAEARSKGKTPVLRGEPGYNPKLDGDKDGKMCE